MIYTLHSSIPEDLPREPVILPPPCPICGQQEVEVATGIWRITHRYEAHGLQRLAEYEKSA